jgi:NAD(P)H-dependent FMN reductase
MKIGIICGSHREPSQSEKVARYLQQQVEAKGMDSWLFLLANNPLPLWDEGTWNDDPKWPPLLDPLKRELAACDGFIVIAPEYHGQVPSGLKNFFLLFGRFELGHKPALIVGVSSADGGAYPVAELRMSSYKNSRICYLPEHLILRHVENILNDNPMENDESADSYFRERIDWSLDLLKGYARALREMRQVTRIHHDKFRNGM